MMDQESLTTRRLYRTFTVLDNLIDSLPPTDLILAMQDTSRTIKHLYSDVKTGEIDADTIEIWKGEPTCTDFEVLGQPKKEAMILLGANYLYFMTKGHFQENDIGRRLIFLSATIFMYLKHFYKVRRYHHSLLDHADAITEQLIAQGPEVNEILKFSNTL